MVLPKSSRSMRGVPNRAQTFFRDANSVGVDCGRRFPTRSGREEWDRPENGFAHRLLGYQKMKNIFYPKAHWTLIARVLDLKQNMLAV